MTTDHPIRIVREIVHEYTDHATAAQDIAGWRLGGLTATAQQFGRRKRATSRILESNYRPDLGIPGIHPKRMAIADPDEPIDWAALAHPAPERAGREGDTQPLPTVSDSPIAHHLVQADLEDRLQLGIRRYGQPLQPHNGRNHLRDAYEEALDLAVYLRAALHEQENPR